MMKHATKSIFVVVFWLLIFGNLSAQKPEFFKGDLSTPNGSDVCNPCVENVIEAVTTLHSHGETLGFNWGDNYPPIQGAGSQNHWQGIQRMPMMGLDVPYLSVASSHSSQIKTPLGIQQVLGPAHFAVVEMGSRDNGFRLRSNRLELGRLTREVLPNEHDFIARSHVITQEYYHPGGMQSIGKYLLVGSDGNINRLSDTALFNLWDMSVPLAPRDVWQSGWQLPPQNANSVGIVRLSDGRYLMLRALVDARELEFYILSFDLEDNPNDYHDMIPWDRWQHAELESELYDSEGSLDLNWADLGTIFGDAGYQNTNIFTECGTGTLYLIATHGRRPESYGGGDFVDAFRLDIPVEQPDPDIPGEGVVITKVANRHLFPGTNSGERQGDLQAAAGAYVSPNNKLYVYATEHGATGEGGFVHMIEFGPRVHLAEATLLDDAWVELYAEPNFGGRSIILDYVDRELRDYNDFTNIEEFNNETSSAVYTIPFGTSLRLYLNTFENGAYVDLVGNGKVSMVDDFGSVMLSDGKNSNNKISSAAWISTTTAVNGEDNQLPTFFVLSQNYPNPFNAETVIRYQLPKEVVVSLEIYNMGGQLIRSLILLQRQAAGFYSIKWDGKDDFGFDVASGTYLYRLVAEEDLVIAKRLTLVR